ncbi:hypothetical protein PUN4_410117 [Paraburkholderia unamae]|nr:hypothetical protein PUN4_410117 [Paraburkholderia unamae]
MLPHNLKEKGKRARQVRQPDDDAAARMVRWNLERPIPLRRVLQQSRILFEALLETVLKRMMKCSGTREGALELQNSLVTSAQTACETRCVSLGVFETGSPVLDRFSENLAVCGVKITTPGMAHLPSFPSVHYQQDGNESPIHNCSYI